MTTRDETSIINIPDRYIQDESEKILKKAAAKESRLSDLGKELLTLRTTGFYNYINKIQPSDMLF